MFKLKDNLPEKRLVIIQCDSGHMIGDLIACARYRIYDLRAKADQDQVTHVLFIIHLPHHVASSSFVGFQGDPWISSHIDDLRQTTDNAVSADEAIGLTISELFLGRSESWLDRDGVGAQDAYGAMSEQGDDEPPPFNRMETESSVASSQQREMSGEFNEGTGSLDHFPERDYVHTQSVEMSSQSEDDNDEEEERRERAPKHWRERVEPGHQESMEVSDDAISQESLQMRVEDIEGDEPEFEDVRGKNMAATSTEDLNEMQQNIFNNVSLQLPSDGGGPADPMELPPGDVEMPVVPHKRLPPLRCPLYGRLHGCIQAAASKLKDITIKRSTKRVEILVHLVPKDPPKELGVLLYLNICRHTVGYTIHKRDISLRQPSLRCV